MKGKPSELAKAWKTEKSKYDKVNLTSDQDAEFDDDEYLPDAPTPRTCTIMYHAFNAFVFWVLWMNNCFVSVPFVGFLAIFGVASNVMYNWVSRSNPGYIVRAELVAAAEALGWPDPNKAPPDVLDGLEDPPDERPVIEMAPALEEGGAEGDEVPITTSEQEEGQQCDGSTEAAAPEGTGKSADGGEVELQMVSSSRGGEGDPGQGSSSDPMTGEEERGLVIQKDHLYAGWCDICQMNRPVRSKHCKQCNRCVWKFDHHCYLMGKCIGEKNHNKFWWLLMFQAVTLWMAVAMLHVYWLPHIHSFKNYLFYLLTWAVYIVLWIFAVVIGVLSITHSFFALTNTTTWESIASEKLDYLKPWYPYISHLPFDQGLAANCSQFCFGKEVTLVPWPERPEKKVDPETGEEIVEEDCCNNRHYSCC